MERPPPRRRARRRAQDSRSPAVTVDARAVIRSRPSSARGKQEEEQQSRTARRGGGRRPTVGNAVVPPPPSDAAQDKAAVATYVYRLPPHSDVKGVFSACTILCLWAAAFYFCHFCVRLTPATSFGGVGGGGLSLGLASSTSTTTRISSSSSASPWWVVLSSFAALTHLYMGLFVTAHDAMHGAVCARSSRRLNDLLGACCIGFYAFFSYARLHEEHWRHHHWTGRTPMAAEIGAAEAATAATGERSGAPGGGGRTKGARTAAAAAKMGQQRGEQLGKESDPPLLRYDPDYHAGDARLLPWFARFMAHYSCPGQYARILAAVALLLLLGAPYANLCLYMCGSAVLAAFQLFYWGTYRPHRPDAAALAAHARKGDASAAEMPWRRSRSAPWPNAVLFFHAYFFSLHYHHHRWPHCPWWDLPRLRREAGAVPGVVPGPSGEEGEEAY